MSPFEPGKEVPTAFSLLLLGFAFCVGGFSWLGLRLNEHGLALEAVASRSF